MERKGLSALAAVGSSMWAEAQEKKAAMENMSAVAVDKGPDVVLSVAPKDARKTKQNKRQPTKRQQANPRKRSKKADANQLNSKLLSVPQQPSAGAQASTSSEAASTSSLPATVAISRSSLQAPIGVSSKVVNPKYNFGCVVEAGPPAQGTITQRHIPVPRMGPLGFAAPLPRHSPSPTYTFGVNPFNPPWCPGFKNVRDDDVQDILTQYWDSPLVLMSWTPTRQMTTVAESDFFVRTFVDSSWGDTGNVVFFCAGGELVRCHSVLLQGILPQFTSELEGMSKYPYNAYVGELPYIPVFVGGVERKCIQQLVNLIYRGSDSFTGKEVHKLNQVVRMLNLYELTICIMLPSEQDVDSGNFNSNTKCVPTSTVAGNEGHSGPLVAQRATIDYGMDEHDGAVAPASGRDEEHAETSQQVSSSGKTNKTTTLRLRSDDGPISSGVRLYIAEFEGSANDNA